MRDYFAGADDDRVAFRAKGTEGVSMQAEWRNGQSAVGWAVAHEPRLAVAIVAHIRVGMPAGMRRELHAMLDATEPYVDDATLTTRVKAKFAEHPTVSGMSISVETLKGTVQLSGFVKTSDEKAMAERLARETSGVVAVRNDLIVRG